MKFIDRFIDAVFAALEVTLAIAFICALVGGYVFLAYATWPYSAPVAAVFAGLVIYGLRKDVNP